MTLQCDLHPHCQAQGCTADPTNCQRVRDLRGGVDKRPDLMPPMERAEFKVMLKGLTDEELFGRWSIEYDARREERVALVIIEMNSRKFNQEAIAL